MTVPGNAVGAPSNDDADLDAALERWLEVERRVEAVLDRPVGERRHRAGDALLALVLAALVVRLAVAAAIATVPAPDWLSTMDAFGRATAPLLCGLCAIGVVLRTGLRPPVHGPLSHAERHGLARILAGRAHDVAGRPRLLAALALQRVDAFPARATGLAVVLVPVLLAAVRIRGEVDTPVGLGVVLALAAAFVVPALVLLRHYRLGRRHLLGR